MSTVTPYAHVWMLVAAAACWGTGTVATKQVLDDVAPLTLLPSQLLASTLFLLAVLGASRTRMKRTPQLSRLAVLGMLNPGLAYAFGLLGLASITASLSVLLWAAEPILILVFAVLLLRERLPAAQVAGMGAALVGVLLVVYEPGAAGDAVGVCLTLAAVAACALYTVGSRHLLVDDASLPVALLQQVAALCLAAVLVAVAALLGEVAWNDWPVTAPAWGGAALSGVLYYGLAFWLYLSGLRFVPASVAGTFLPLIPVFGIAAALIVGERLSDRQWIGAAVVVAAVSLVAALQARRPRKATEPVSVQ